MLFRSYGEQPGTEPNYRLVAELDEALRRHGTPSTDATTAAVPDTWAPLR